MTQHPIGSGPFRFVSAETDKEVILQRNDTYWGAKPHLGRVRFVVVPDANTQALELRKGSADLTINSPMPPDTVLTLERDPALTVQRGPGTRLAYLAFNLRDPILKDVRVRQAIAYALGSSPDDRVPLAQPGAGRRQRSAAPELGLRRRCASIRLTIPRRLGSCSTQQVIRK